MSVPTIGSTIITARSKETVKVLDVFPHPSGNDNLKTLLVESEDGSARYTTFSL
jgi:hypothetical protein